MLGYLLFVLVGIIIVLLVLLGGFLLGVISTKRVINDHIKTHGDKFIDHWKEKHMKGV